MNRRVYCETFRYIDRAIARETEIKKATTKETCLDRVVQPSLGRFGGKFECSDQLGKSGFLTGKNSLSVNLEAFVKTLGGAEDPTRFSPFEC